MDRIEALIAGPAGPALAILMMALATYGCRLAGAVLMSRVEFTPAIRRALAALPGSIVAATVVPIALRSGPPGIAGIVAGMLATRLVRQEVVGLIVGLAVAAAVRAAGF